MTPSQKPSCLAIILVDGMRPDGLLQANTPTLDRLISEGASTLQARTVMPSITLPCISSLFLGVTPRTHKVITNTWKMTRYAQAGMIDQAHQAGLRTAMFYNWAQLRDIARPGSLDVGMCLNNSEDKGRDPRLADAELTDLIVSWLTDHAYDLLFIYLGGTDTAGHRDGWMSEPYLQTISHADHCIGQILATLGENATVIVLSDHGGHFKLHGTPSAEDMTIPIILHGESIQPGQRLNHKIRILDIAPTVAHILDFPPGNDWQGQVLTEALNS